MEKNNTISLIIQTLLIFFGMTIGFSVGLNKSDLMEYQKGYDAGKRSGKIEGMFNMSESWLKAIEVYSLCGAKEKMQ